MRVGEDRAGVFLSLGLAVLGLLLLAAPAFAGPPSHLRTPALDVSGLNHACGVAIDSEGDLYASSAGESKIEVFASADHGTPIGEIADTHEPCGLAVDTLGHLYVLQRATGEVVRYTPAAYPFVGAPSYGAAEPIDTSGEAKGIAVDPTDNRLYVAEGTHVAVYEADGSFEADVGEPALIEASGVAIYTAPSGVHYLFASDGRGPAADELLLFNGQTSAGLKLRREITGASTPDGSFQFGPAGTYLAADPGNKESGGDKCAAMGKQACTAGHVLVYDAGHDALDEFEATGEYLDQMQDLGFADAEPTAMAVDRSGGFADGTIYVSAGSAAGANVLAFGPLAPPRRQLSKQLSHVLKGATAVTTDGWGNVYVAAGSAIHIFRPDGSEIQVGSDGNGIEDIHTPLGDLAVDSEGHLYVAENGEGSLNGAVTYYTPSVYPPQDGTTYIRHEPPVAIGEASYVLQAIAVDPGPGPGRDRLFLVANSTVREYDSIKNGSTLLNPDLIGTLNLDFPQSISVRGASGNATLYLGLGSHDIVAVNGSGSEIIGRWDGSGCPAGESGFNPRVAVDQANGHVLEFQPTDEAAREYDGSGACVAEFGHFTTLARSYRIAVDSACATHVNESTGETEPLDETTVPTCEEYDPANGTVYVAYDDTAPGTFDVSAFGPLSYAGPPESVTEPPGPIGGGQVTFNGTINPEGFEVTECEFEYVEEEDFEASGFTNATVAQCTESAAQIGEGEAPISVHATVGLDVESNYYCARLVAGNEFGTEAGEEVCFGAPRVETESPDPIADTEATLRASIDPSGLPTTYRFEYGLAAGEYEHSTPPRALPADAGPTEAQALAVDLAEGTEYHFRVIAENEAASFVGPDQVFRTLARRGVEHCPNAEFRTGLSAGLPDCRAYELVTPAQANGLRFFVDTQSAPVAFDDWLTPPRGPGAGESLSYYVNGTLPGFEGNGVYDGYRAARAPTDHPVAGWQSQLFGPTFKEAVTGVSSTPTPEGLSADQLYSVWGIHPEEASAELPTGVYLRVPDGGADSRCLTPPLPARLDFELLGCGPLGTDPSAAIRFASPGGAHVIFSSTAHLEGEAPPVGNQAIYDRPAGSSNAAILARPPGDASAAERAEFEAALKSKEQAKFLGANPDGTAVAFRAGARLYLRSADDTKVISPNTATVGDILSCAAGPLFGVSQQRRVQWLRDGVPIPGTGEDDVTGKTDYTTVPADEGGALQCLARAPGVGTGTVAVSNPVEIAPLSPAQLPQPPAEIAPPSPADPGAGTVESCVAGGWSDATSFAYQWYVNGTAIPGATSETYAVKAADVPGTIQCVVSGSNADSTVAKASGPTATSPAPAEPTPLATAEAAAKATFAGISEDGRYVFYVLGSGASPGRLFRFDAEDETATEIAPDSTFINVSGDGSEAFFSSTDVFTDSEENENGEAAQASAHNLYRFDFATSTTDFIARLDSTDFQGAAFGGTEGMNLAAWVDAVNPSQNGGRGLDPTRSTPDGSVLLFQSHARLTPYANNGIGEIYRYDSTAPAGERLTCPSCHPSGHPPTAEPLLQDLRSGAPLNAHTLLANLSDDGSRVLFTAPDRLLPQDANAANDVYEWRTRGSTWGNFPEAPLCERPGGCLALISSGQGERDSFLYSASADGHDIFLRTLERLVGADVPGSFSIYDAREGGGIPEPAAREECGGDACQPQGAEPPILPAPASTGSEGGNVVQRGCPKGRHRVKGRCVKNHRHEKHRHRHSHRPHRRTAR